VPSFALSGIWQGLQGGAVSYHNISSTHPSLLFSYCCGSSMPPESICTALPLQSSEGIIEMNGYLSLPKTSSVHMCMHLSLGISLCCLRFKGILVKQWQLFTSLAKQDYQPECNSQGIQWEPSWAVAATVNAHTETVSLWNKIRLIWKIRRLLTKTEDNPVPIQMSWFRLG